MSAPPRVHSLPALDVDGSRPFAVLADLHANLEALETVTAWLDARGVDQAVVLGDVIGYGASPRRTVERVRSRGWYVVRGNHEDMLLDPAYVERTRSVKRSARRALDWTRESLDPEALAWMRSLPPIARLGSRGLAVHGSLVDPRHCYAYIYEFSVDRNAERLHAMDAPPGTVLWFGHTHAPAAFRAGADGCEALEPEPERVLAPPGRFLVNPGSLGFPRDGDPRAAFAVFDPRRSLLTRVRVAYDVELAAARIRKAGYGDEIAERLLAAR